MSERLIIKVNYYDSGFCQLHVKLVEGQEYRGHLCVPDMLEFDPENKPDPKTLPWHTVSDPNGYAEPCSPLKKEIVEMLEWADE